MALVGGGFEPALCLGAVGGNAATETECLAQVEGGVGIALVGKVAPDRHGPGVVALLPGFDAGLGRRRGGKARSLSKVKPRQQGRDAINQ